MNSTGHAFDVYLHSELRHPPASPPRQYWKEGRSNVSGPAWASGEIVEIQRLCEAAGAAVSRLEAVQDGVSDSDVLHAGYTRADIPLVREDVSPLTVQLFDLWNGLMACEDFDSADRLRTLLNDKDKATRLVNEIQTAVATLLHDTGGDHHNDDQPEQ